jgi:hypothetical protein
MATLARMLMLVSSVPSDFNSLTISPANFPFASSTVVEALNSFLRLNGMINALTPGVAGGQA